MSPRAPQPKSAHPRHTKGAYARLNERSGAGPSHKSQSKPSGTGSASLGRLIANRNLRCHTSLARNFGHAPRLIDCVRQRLLAKNVFALLHRRRRYGCMQVIRGAHNDRVDVLLFFQKLAEVAVSRAATILAGALLRTIVGVHDFLTRLAAGNAASYAQRMIQLNGFVRTEPIPPAIDTQQFAHGVAELMGVPLWVIRASLIRIAHRHALHVRLAQKAQHHAQTLRPDADKSNIDLVAGRNISHAAQHAARNDRKPDRRRGRLPDELAPRNRSF